MFKRFLSRKEQEQVEEERKEMEISLPTNFQRGVHIEHDAANNTYKGIPTAWRDAVPDAEVSEEDGVGGYEIPEFLIPTNHKALQQQEALRSSSGGGDNRISRPFNFKHETHVKVSKSASTGFEGLPDEWRKLLKDSGITKEETLNNPQIVLDVLEFRAGACSRPPPPRNQDFMAAQKRACSFEMADPRSRFSGLHEVAKGSTGLVYEGFDLQKKRKVAIKRLDLGKQTDIPALENEIAMMNLSRHDNIVEYVGAYMWENQLWIVMESMRFGALCDLVAATDLDEPAIAYICKEVANALAFLHTRSRIHRDIKSDNILLGEGAAVKLADFGYCVQLTDEQKRRNSLVGTPYWMAPELIRTQYYDEKVDVWSAGVLAIECAEREPPFFEEPIMRALFLITSRGSPGLKEGAKWSQDFHDYLSKCLNMEPSNRWSASQLLEHPFIAKACSKDQFAELLQKAKITPTGTGPKAAASLAPKAAALPKESKAAALPKESKAAALPKESKAAALPKESKAAALPKESKAAALPKESPAVPAARADSPSGSKRAGVTAL